MQKNILIIFMILFVSCTFYIKKLKPSHGIKKVLLLILILNLIIFGMFISLNQKIYSEMFSNFSTNFLVILSVSLTYIFKYIFQFIDLAHSFPALFIIAVFYTIFLLVSGLIRFKKLKFHTFFLGLLSALCLILLFYILGRTIVCFNSSQGQMIFHFSFIIESIIKFGKDIIYFLTNNMVEERKIIIIATFAMCVILFSRKVKNIYIYLILISMFLSIVAQSYIITGSKVIAIYLYIIVGIVLLLSRLYPSPNRLRRNIAPSKQIMLISLILVISMILGLYKLSFYPPFYHSYPNREAIETTRLATYLNRVPSSWQNCMTDIKLSPISLFLWEPKSFGGPVGLNLRASAHNPLYNLTAFICLKVFPISLVTFRISSVLNGILAVLFLFLLVRVWFNSQIALISAFLLSISSWQLSLIRQSWNTSAPLYLLICLYLLGKALKSKRLIFYILLAFALTLSGHFNPQVKGVLGLVVIFLLLRCIIERNFLKNHYQSMLVMIIAFIALLYIQKIPLVNYFYYRGAGANTVFHDTIYLGNIDKIIVIGKQLVLAFYGFLNKIYWPSLFNLNRCNYMARGIHFNIILLAFSTYGFFLCIFNLRRRNHSMLLLWLLYSMFPNIVTGGGGVARRAILIVAPILVLAALSMYTFWSLIIKSVFKSDRWYKPITIITTIVFFFILLATSSANYFHTYYLQDKGPTAKQNQLQVNLGLYLEKLLDNHYRCFVTKKIMRLTPLGIANQCIKLHMYAKRDNWFVERRVEVVSSLDDLISKSLNSPIVDNNVVIISDTEKSLITDIIKMFPDKYVYHYNYTLKPNFALVGLVLDKQDIIILKNPKN